MRSRLFVAIVSAGLLLTSTGPSAAQPPDYFVGAVLGVATLSGDPSSRVTGEGFALSKYKPENGATVNLFFGAHLSEYVSVQANYIRNHNDLALFAAEAARAGVRFFEQPLMSTQHQVVGDVLVYFRERASRLRPYLSAGLGIVRFGTSSRGMAIDGGLPPPPAMYASTDATLRVAVGADVPVGGRVVVRYSFSENIGPNPISRVLDPQGMRALMNFQNLVGLMVRF